MAIQIITDKANQEAIRLVSDRFMSASTELGPSIQKWRNLIDMYDLGTRRNMDRTRDERGEFVNSDKNIWNLSASVLYSNVETVFARLAALFDPEGWHTVTPRGTTPYESAILVEEMLQQQMDEDEYGGMNEVLLDALKQAVQIGHATIKIWWGNEQGKVYERRLVVDSTGKQVERFVAKKGTIFNGPKIALVPYHDFYTDPKGRSRRTCEYVIEDSVQSIDFADEMVRMGFYDKDTVDKLRKTLEDDNSFGDPKTHMDQLYRQHDTHRKDFRVLIYQENLRYIYAAVPSGIGAIDGNHLLILNKKNQDNPFDFRTDQYITIGVNFNQESVFPKGIIEPLRDDQAIETTFLNMGFEAAVKILRPMTIVSDDLGLDNKELQTYIPGKQIEADVLSGTKLKDSILELKPEVNVLNAMTHLKGIISQHSEEVGANTQYVTGTAGVGSNKTARGAALLTQNALQRDVTPKQKLSIAMTQLLQMMHSLNQQHGDPNKDDIYGMYNFKVFEQSAVDSAIRQQTLERMLPFIAQLGGNSLNVIKRILKTGGVGAISSIFPNDGSMQRNQNSDQQQQILQLLAQQNGGGNQTANQ